MRVQKQRKAFTMIELLFVIVIMGIVGGLALEAVRQYYNGIYRTQELLKRTETADNVLEQLSHYLEYAIDGSIVNLDKQGGAQICYGVPIPNDPEDYTVAFVGVDNDSLRTTGGRPGWSSEVRLIAGNNNIVALDANYSAADTIITGLGSSLAQSALYDADSADVNACVRFNLNDDNGVAGYHNINSKINDFTLALATDNNATDGKRKYLLRTAYAFRVERDSNGSFFMYTGFRPWEGERYTEGAAKKNLLAQKVNHFYVDYDQSTNISTSLGGKIWRLKVCMQGLDENLSDTDNDLLQICRERNVHVRYY